MTASPGAVVGRLAEVYRYPVKSTSGESLPAVAVERRGLAGDRLWSVRDPDGRLGSGKSTRRFRRMPGLLELVAAYDGDVPVVSFPDGRTLRGDDPALDGALSDHVGRPVTLAREAEVSHFDEGPLHLVTTASLRRLAAGLGRPVDPRRFRPNLVVDVAGEDGFAEESWCGRRLQVGGVVLRVGVAMPRCVMVGLAQQGMAADPGVLDAVAALNDLCLGVVADVEVTGEVRVGDPVVLAR